MTVSSSIHSILPEPVKLIFGDRNRNIVGRNVRFSPIVGNTTELVFNILIRGTVAETI